MDDNDTMDDYSKMHPRMHFEDWVKNYFMAVVGPVSGRGDRI